MVNVETVYLQCTLYVPFHNAVKIRLCQRFYRSILLGYSMQNPIVARNTYTTRDLQLYKCIFRITRGRRVFGGVWLRVNPTLHCLSIEWRFMRRSGRRASWVPVGQRFFRSKPFSGPNSSGNWYFVADCPVILGGNTGYLFASIHPECDEQRATTIQHHHFQGCISITI